MPAEALDPAERIACLGLSFHLLAYYEEDTGRRVPGVAVEEPCTITIVDPWGCGRDSLEAFKRAAPVLLRVPLLDYEARCSPQPAGLGGQLRYNDITRLIASSFLGAYRRRLEEQAATGYEHFLVVGWNGETASGRGGETSIALPELPAVVMAHTHPGPSCYPSGRDLYSAAGFLSQGGLVEVIVSASCVSMLRLTSPLSEKDYWLLNQVAERLVKAKSGEEYLAALGWLGRLETVGFEVV